MRLFRAGKFPSGSWWTTTRKAFIFVRDKMKLELWKGWGPNHRIWWCGHGIQQGSESTDSRGCAGAAKQAPDGQNRSRSRLDPKTGARSPTRSTDQLAALPLPSQEGWLAGPEQAKRLLVRSISPLPPAAGARRSPWSGPRDATPPKLERAPRPGATSCPHTTRGPAAESGARGHPVRRRDARSPHRTEATPANGGWRCGSLEVSLRRAAMPGADGGVLSVGVAACSTHWHISDDLVPPVFRGPFHVAHQRSPRSPPEKPTSPLSPANKTNAAWCVLSHGSIAWTGT
jgi:hypothetical protein